MLHQNTGSGKPSLVWSALSLAYNSSLFRAGRCSCKPPDLSGGYWPVKLWSPLKYYKQVPSSQSKCINIWIIEPLPRIQSVGFRLYYRDCSLSGAGDAPPPDCLTSPTPRVELPTLLIFNAAFASRSLIWWQDGQRQRDSQSWLDCLPKTYIQPALRWMTCTFWPS
jgi:hypothetical protein